MSTDDARPKFIAGFEQGIKVIGFQQFNGSLYVATDNGVYIVFGDRLKLLKIEC